MRAARALEALNFFLADVQAGIGPFIGVILLSRGWGADAIGSVMTLAEPPRWPRRRWPARSSIRCARSGR